MSPGPVMTALLSGARPAERGVLVIAAFAADDGPAYPDVRRLRELRGEANVLETLDGLVEGEGLRGAAVKLGIYHSTLQARALNVIDRLGFDPRTSLGQARHVSARQFMTIADARLY